MNYLRLTLLTLFLSLLSCNQTAKEEAQSKPFQYESERFADLRILRYQIPGFEELSLEKKKLAYYLYEAALSGREIIYDQKYKHNLKIKRSLEEIVKHYAGDRSQEDFQKFMVYMKRIWFSNGIHHHYGNTKFIPELSFDTLLKFAKESKGAKFPLKKAESIDELFYSLKDVIFDPKLDAKLVNKSKDADLIAESAVNFYENVNQKEVEAFYAKKMAKKEKNPPSYGLNSKLIKENGIIKEKLWKVGSMYSAAIEKIVFWLEKASSVAENAKQKKAFDLLIQYYKSGDLKDFDAYNIAWVQDTKSDIDVINGFIEVYNDPKGFRGSFESVVQIKDPIATKRIKALADNAQWFEDHSPLMDEHKKKKVVGITANIINVIVESGDASPSTPIGINLPNANWIRKEHGSKSVNLANIVDAYNQSGSGSLQEFAYSLEEIERSQKYGELAGHLHTDLHEVIGHASGQLEKGVGTTKETLKNYASTLEEARADLVGLYFLMDKKLIELGLIPSLDVGKEAYDSYIRNGLLLQLRRLKLGDDIEEDHMRNRQLIAKWILEKGAKDQVVEKKERDGKSYYIVTNYEKMRELVGQLLREIQRIKSQGDFKAGQDLVENYGVKVDQELHKEVLDRYKKLKVSPYSGFINPKLIPVMENGEIRDVKVEYPKSFEKQMLEYAEKYAFLPTEN